MGRHPSGEPRQALRNAACRGASAGGLVAPPHRGLLRGAYKVAAIATTRSDMMQQGSKERQTVSVGSSGDNTGQEWTSYGVTLLLGSYRVARGLLPHLASSSHFSTVRGSSKPMPARSKVLRNRTIRGKEALRVPARAGKGDSVASAIRLSWPRPPEGALSCSRQQEAPISPTSPAVSSEGLRQRTSPGPKSPPWRQGKRISCCLQYCSTP